MWYSNTTFKKALEKQDTFRSPSGKEKQLDYVVIDRRNNRRYCSDAEANDMIHKESGHRSVTAHFPIPILKNEGRIGKQQNSNRISTKIQDTRDTLHQWNHAKIPTHQKNTKKIEQIYDELERGSLASMKQ